MSDSERLESLYYKEALDQYNELRQEEDPDAWDARISKTGCYVENLALQLCHAETNDWRQCMREMGFFRQCWDSKAAVPMRTRPKPSKKAALKRLHQTLRSLLDKPVQEINDGKRGVPEIPPTPKSSSAKRIRKATLSGKDDSAYVLSKEDQLIPKLSDNEIMERHKRADENMRQVWTNIIRKYESIEDQGDVLDLHTGEVVEDNGHIRGLSNDISVGDTRYQSVLKDIIEFNEERDNDKFALWGDDDAEDPSDGDYESENDGEAEVDDDTEDDTDYTDYKKLLKGKIEATSDNVGDV